MKKGLVYLLFLSLGFSSSAMAEWCSQDFINGEPIDSTKSTYRIIKNIPLGQAGFRLTLYPSQEFQSVDSIGRIYEPALRFSLDHETSSDMILSCIKSRDKWREYMSVPINSVTMRRLWLDNFTHLGARLNFTYDYIHPQNGLTRTTIELMPECIEVQKDCN